MTELSVACNTTTTRPALASILLHLRVYPVRVPTNASLTTGPGRSRLCWGARAPSNPQPRMRQTFSCACSDSQHSSTSAAQQVEDNKGADVLSFLTSLYPVYVTAGGVLAFTYPPAFSWFVVRGPSSYSLALATIMLAMGLSLSLEELFDVITKRPFQVFLISQEF